jgi:hypothetical protein
LEPHFLLLTADRHTAAEEVGRQRTMNYTKSRKKFKSGSSVNVASDKAAFVPVVARLLCCRRQRDTIRVIRAIRGE